MYRANYSRIKPVLLRLMMIVFLLPVISVCSAQVAASLGTKPSTPFEEMMPDLIKADTLDKVLPLFSPPVTKTQIVKSDYLLLDVPPIALAGTIPVRLMSELPGTEFFLLFNTTPRPGEPSFLIAQDAPALTKPDVRVNIKLSNSTELLLVVRANGIWYSVSSDVKIAQKHSK